MQNLDQILGDKQFWRFEVRGRKVGTRWNERQRQIIETGRYGRHELYLALNDFLTELFSGNDHVEMYVVMSDGDPALVDAGEWERLIAWPDPTNEVTNGWGSHLEEVHTIARDIEVVFT